MAELSEGQRDKLPASAFAYIDGKGERHLPINDEGHIRNAMSRFDQTDFESAAAKERARRKTVAAANKHDIQIGESDNVAKRAN